jgi:hypothetical protein
MTLYAYKLEPFFLNAGWVGIRTVLQTYSEIDEGDEYIDDVRRRIAERLDQVSVLFLDLGLREVADPVYPGEMWFAPLPTADGPDVECDFIVAVLTDAEAYVASPVELPWLAAKALDFRRSEILETPPTGTVN